VQELGELYSKYQKKGLVILGFPCNQFNGQEPGDNKEIKQFAKSKGADFPMMSKIEVNGANGEINTNKTCVSLTELLRLKLVYCLQLILCMVTSKVKRVES